MTYILTRAGKDGKWKECTCSLHIDSNRSFVVYFDEVTPEIGLNDGNFHSLTQLNGLAHDIIVNREGIFLEGCFVKINNKWHRDGFLFRFHR
jgi:hypothetical protein